MNNIPVNAPTGCPGTESTLAGKSKSCEGCPNQKACESGKSTLTDVQDVKQSLSKVRRVIVVLSGKGGVGKSTITTNLAFELAKNENAQIGVLDLDICGSSLPQYMGVKNSQVYKSIHGWSPVDVKDNLKLMSVGFLLSSPEQALIWNGSRKNGMIISFLKDVNWGNLDYLIIDTPPGTSDEHLAITNYLNKCHLNCGSLIVTTAQEVSIQDIRRQITFCKKVKMSVIGIVENMSSYTCSNCLHEYKIFPTTTGGSEQLASDSDCKLICKIPLTSAITKTCDVGYDQDSLIVNQDTSKHFMLISQIVEKHCINNFTNNV